MQKELFRIGPETTGGGPLVSGWNSKGSLLAVVGNRRGVSIFRRDCSFVEDVLPLSRQTVSGRGHGADQHALEDGTFLSWSPREDKLALVFARTPGLLLWNALTRETTFIDTGQHEISFLSWNKGGSHIAIATAKGNLIIYDDGTGSKVSVMGKHTRRVICGTWTRHNYLILGGEDKQERKSILDTDPLFRRFEYIHIHQWPRTWGFVQTGCILACRSRFQI